MRPAPFRVPAAAPPWPRSSSRRGSRRGGSPEPPRPAGPCRPWCQGCRAARPARCSTRSAAPSGKGRALLPPHRPGLLRPRPALGYGLGGGRAARARPLCAEECGAAPGGTRDTPHHSPHGRARKTRAAAGRCAARMGCGCCRARCLLFSRKEAARRVPGVGSWCCLPVCAAIMAITGSLCSARWYSLTCPRRFRQSASYAALWFYVCIF